METKDDHKGSFIIVLQRTEQIELLPRAGGTAAERLRENLGRLILRYAAAGGRPMSSAEFCHAHARVRIARDRAAGLKVYDDREPT